MQPKERFYKVGKHLDNGRKFYQDSLQPMPHKEAMTFISKMMNPALWFVYEVEQNAKP